MNSNLKKLIFFVLMLAVAYVGYQYMIKPANQALAEQQTRVQTNMDKLEKFEQNTTTVKDLGKQLEKLEEAITFFESKLPPKEEIHKVLEQVTVIAQKRGLQPKTIRTLKKRNNNGYIEQPLKMELVGSFRSFYSFMLDLEKLPRITKICELKLEKKKNGDGDISADFIVSIFFQNDLG